MGSQPGAPQRPEAFGGVGMNRMKVIAVFVAGK